MICASATGVYDFVLCLNSLSLGAVQALDKLTHLYCIKDALLGGLQKRQLVDLKQQYVAELSVKKILLGLGSRQSLQQYALQQPLWATGGSKYS